MTVEDLHVQIDCPGPVFLPCWNEWGRDVYLQTGDFDLDPVTVPASSTSGSPVLLADGLFVGLLAPVPGTRFVRRGRRLTVSGPTPPFVREGEPFAGWAEYSRIVLGGTSPATPVAPFHDAIEYCTWVEQTARGEDCGTGPREQLTDAFIDEYLDRIDALDLPRGKVTIDDGWAPGNSAGGVGDWDVEQKRIAELGKVAERIRDRGHVPGLWFGAGRAAVRSAFFRHDPAAFHPVVIGTAESENRGWYERYADATAGYLDHLRTVFGRYADLGFAKFKLDLYYGPKDRMTAQLHLAHSAIKDLDPQMEVEHHLPDVFASRFADVVRTNDVVINSRKPWRSVVAAHWLVSRWSCPATVLNLDHIGGNDPRVAEADYLEHLDMMAKTPGQPVVSLLPDHLSGDAIDRVRDALNAYNSRRGPIAWPEVIEWAEFLELRSTMSALDGRSS